MGDWDRKPREPGSIWLKLKAKGDKIRIRIAASPYREVQIWPSERGGQRLDQEMVNAFTEGQWVSVMSNPDWNVSEVYYLLVIDRADSQPKIYTTSGAVYGKIRDFATDPEWGNPMGYDITVERTEDPGKSYWKVTPSPMKSELMSSELKLVESLIDKLSPGALPANSPQPDDIGDNVTAEPLPWDKPLGTSPGVTHTVEPSTPLPEPKPKNQVDDIVIEDLGDEPINLDDIPFDDDPSTSEKGSQETKS